MSHFGHGPLGYTCKEQIQKFPSIPHTGLNAKNRNVNNTIFMREKKMFPKMLSKAIIDDSKNRNENFEIIGLAVLSTQLYEEIK